VLALPPLDGHPPAVPFVAEASIRVNAPSSAVFDTLADHDGWSAWMPRSFRPVGRPLGKLSAGARPRVRIAGARFASPIEVTVVDRPREITWRGGIGKLLFAEHRFLFADTTDGGTEVRSVETWDGLIAPFVRPIVKRVAEKVGREQLAALARAAR
jgi:hypothetical protein